MSYDGRTSAQVAKQIRQAMTEARRAGALPQLYTVSVRIDDSHTHQAVNVRILRTAAPPMWPYQSIARVVDGSNRWLLAEDAIEVARRVRALAGPVIGEWDDGQGSFVSFYFRDGINAPE
jgi:hypothetical protein